MSRVNYIRSLLHTASVIATVLVAAIAATVALPTAVHADDWGTNTSDVGAHPDGGSTYWCLGSTIDPYSTLVNAANYATEYSLDNPTQAIAVYMSVCDISSSDGDGQTDVLWSQKEGL